MALAAYNIKCYRCDKAATKPRPSLTRPHSPFPPAERAVAELVRLSRKSIADEMREEHGPAGVGRLI
jgi:hypothetical protein